MDVKLPDGRIVRNVPEGTTQEELLERLAEAGIQFKPAAPVKSTSFEAGAKADPQMRSTLATLQGPAFGFADEIIGGVAGAVQAPFSDRPFRENYQSARDYVRGATAAEMAESPGRTLAAQTLPMLMAGRLPGMQALGRGGMIRQSVTGGGLAGISGLVNALGAEEQINSDTPRNVGKQVALAMGLGLAATPVASAIGGAGNALASVFNRGSADDYAARKVAEALLRDTPPNVTATTARPAARVATLGPEARVVDAGGQNTRALLDVTASIPGRTKQATETAIRARQASRGTRLIGAAQDELNPSGLRLGETLDELVAERTAKAAPLYAKLDRMSVTVDDELTGIIEAATKVGAAGKARTIATARQQPFTLPGTTSKAPAGQSFVDVDGNPLFTIGGGAGGSKVRVTDLDRLKRGLDDIVSSHKDPKTGKLDEVGSAVLDLKQSLTAKVDAMTGGAYAKARQAFAGPSALIDAAQSGRRAMSMDDFAIGKALKDMTEGEIDAFRLGAAEALRAKLGTQGGQTQIMNMWREPTMQEKLRAIFGSERAYRNFATRVASESRMRGIESVGRGSQTAGRQFAEKDLDADLIQDAGAVGSNVAQGRFGQATANAVRMFRGMQTPEKARDEIGRLLLQQGPQAQMTLRQLEDILRQVEAQRAQLVYGAGVTAPLATNPLIQR